MDEFEICRFCLISLDDDMNNIPLSKNEQLAKMIQVVNPSMNAWIIKNPVICEVCLVNLKVTNNFILELKSTESEIALKAGPHSKSVDLMELKGCKKVTDPKVCVCRICLKLNVAGSCMGLLQNTNGYLQPETLRKMLSFCFNQMNFNLTTTAFMCNNCWGVLQIAYNFKKSCVDTEERIKIYTNRSNHRVLHTNDFLKLKNIVLTKKEIPDPLTDHASAPAIENNELPYLGNVRIKEELPEENDIDVTDTDIDIERNNFDMIETKMEVVDHIVERDHPYSESADDPIRQDINYDSFIDNLSLSTRLSALTKEFIGYVKERPILWSIQRGRKKSVELEKAWIEIHKLLNGCMPIQALKTKWAGLYNQYVKLKFDVNYLNGNGKVANWIYFEDMEFMQAVVLKRRKVLYDDSGNFRTYKRKEGLKRVRSSKRSKKDTREDTPPPELPLAMERKSNQNLSNDEEFDGDDGREEETDASQDKAPVLNPQVAPARTKPVISSVYEPMAFNRIRLINPARRPPIRANSNNQKFTITAVQSRATNSTALIRPPNPTSLVNKTTSNPPSILVSPQYTTMSQPLSTPTYNLARSNIVRPLIQPNVNNSSNTNSDAPTSEVANAQQSSNIIAVPQFMVQTSTNSNNEDDENVQLQSKHKKLEEFYHGNLACAHLADILEKLPSKVKCNLESQFMNMAYNVYQRYLESDQTNNV